MSWLASVVAPADLHERMGNGIKKLSFATERTATECSRETEEEPEQGAKASWKHIEIHGEHEEHGVHEEEPALFPVNHLAEFHGRKSTSCSRRSGTTEPAN